MAYIKQITIPNGDGTSTTYDIRDQQAWEQLIQKLEKKVVPYLPPKPGTPGVTYTEDEIAEMLRTIYLVPDPNASQGGQNSYMEYVLINTGTAENPTYEWEKLGTTETDLSGYSLSGHVHQVTPQTRVADHNFTVQGTLPNLEFTGSSSSVTGSVTLNSGDVTIGISTSGEGTTYTPTGSLFGTTDEEGLHSHVIKKNKRYLERTTITGVSSPLAPTTVMAHNDNYNDTTHNNVVKLTDGASTHQHIIPGFADASLTGALAVGNNIATNGTLEDVASDNHANEVFHSASVTDGVLSFGLKQLSKNVSAVTGIGTLGTDAKKTTSTGQDSFSVYHSGDMSTATIKNWDLKEEQLSIPTVNATGTVVATGNLTDTSTYDSTNNAEVVADVLDGNATNPSTGTTSSVETSDSGAHYHEVSENVIFAGDSVKFSGSLDSGSGTVSGTVTPNGSVSYVGGATWESDEVVLSHTVYNPMVFTSPDTNEANNTNNWYGVTYNEDDADPDKSFGRIGNMSMHALLPVQSKMVRCLLNDDGTVNYYLDPSDSTKKYNGTYNGVTSDGSNADLSGASGQVMVEVPEHWYYVTKDDNGQVTAMLSPVSQQGWVHMPKYYVSAYLASVSGGKMVSASGVNPLKGNFDGTNNFRTIARARGVSGEAKWNVYPYDIHLDLVWMYVIEYANLNGRESYNASLTQEGYHQGGLGNGKSTGIVDSIPTGITNTLGNNSGYSEDGNTNEKSVSYRGIEDFWGNGKVMTEGTWLTSLGTSNSVTGFEVYYTDNPSKYANTKPNDARKIAEITNNNGYLKSIVIGEDGMGHISHNGLGGGSTSYYCSYVTKFTYYGFVSQRNFAFGANSLFDISLNLNYAVSSSVFFFARLCFYDKTNV
jgi:hypothetical protein